jgi:hypothetical protein
MLSRFTSPANNPNSNITFITPFVSTPQTAQSVDNCSRWQQLPQPFPFTGHILATFMTKQSQIGASVKKMYFWVKLQIDHKRLYLCRHPSAMAAEVIANEFPFLVFVATSMHPHLCSSNGLHTSLDSDSDKL